MFLRDNLIKIKQAIIESCENKPGLIMKELTYDDNTDTSKLGIKLSIIFTSPQSQKPKKYTLEYLENNHNKHNDDESWTSFLDDINTDLQMLDITSAVPGLQINGWSWPDNRVTLNDETEIYNFNKYFNPETGLFNIELFLKEKNAAQESRAELRFFTTRGGAAAASTSLPKSYTSIFRIKKPLAEDNTSDATKVQASASDDADQDTTFKP